MWGIFKRTGFAARGLPAAALSVEPVSGELHRRHRVSAQGYYRGRKVVQTADKADAGGGEEQGG